MMTDNEREIAKRRAGAFVDAAICRELHDRQIAQSAIPLALFGSIQQMAEYSILADRHDDARVRLVGWQNHEAAL